MIENEHLISIIIPIHNGEKYLKKCLESLYQQTYKNLELILVDDGSTDESCLIYNEYSDKFLKFFVIKHPKAKGVSFSRNEGLKYVHGRYISFVDCDDYVDNEYFEYLIDQIKKNGTDIEVCSFIKETEDGNIIKKSSKVINKIFVLDNTYDSFAQYAHRGVWAILFHRDILNISGERRIQFDEKISIGEDLLFYTKILSNAKKVHYNSETPCYHYVVHGDSSYHSADVSKLYTNIEAHKSVVNIIKDCGYPLAAESAQKYLVYKYCDIFPFIEDTDLEIRKKVRKEMIGLLKFVLLSDFGVRFQVKWIKMILNLCLKSI